MKQWEFKKWWKKRWGLLKAGTIFTFRESTAYSANNWGSLISTISYMITWIVFLEVIFGRTQGIAGYSFNQILFFNLTYQLVFMIVWFGSLSNLERFGEMVRTGDLDLILTKPLPHQFYISFGKIDIPGMLMNMVVSIIPLLTLLIKKGGVEIELVNVMAGLWVVAMGIWAVHCFQFIFTCLVMKTGQSRNLFRLTYELSLFGNDVPFEGFPNWFKVIGLVIIPCLVPGGVGASVMLGKSSALGWVVFATFLGVYFLYFKNYIWQKMIKEYQSASS